MLAKVNRAFGRYTRHWSPDITIMIRAILGMYEERVGSTSDFSRRKCHVIDHILFVRQLVVQCYNMLSDCLVHKMHHTGFLLPSSEPRIENSRVRQHRRNCLASLYRVWFRWLRFDSMAKLKVARPLSIQMKIRRSPCETHNGFLQ